MIRLLLCAALLLVGCEEATTLEPLAPTTFDAVSQATMLDLAASPGFADERGGGVFIDLAGRVVRVRGNGDRGVLESHPRNTVLPGPASAVFALGPSNALVATSRGLFVADQGWLIAPSWQALLPAEGLLGTALGGDGVAWLAHTQGLYRLERGVLTEFKLSGERLSGLTAMAVAPTLDGTPGVWFARMGKLYAAAQSSRTEFTVRDSGLSAETLAGGVLGLAGISPSRETGGELWAITSRGLLLYTGTSWREYSLGPSPRKLLAAGRFAWMQAGDGLYRYDGDTRGWALVQGLESAGTLMGVDSSGSAWVRVGTRTVSIAPSVTPRVRGLFQAARVFDNQLIIEASLPSATAFDSLSWDLDGVTVRPVVLTDGVVGSGPTAGQTFHSLGGSELGGVLKPVSLSTLADGWHTLTLSATAGEVTSYRRVHFEFLGASTAAVSWETDIKQLGLDRCSKCHATGTAPELITYEQWKANAAFIASAVRDSRMPADGPLDTAGVAAIIRWVNGGTQP
ncbi:MAG: hypothetical protein Q8N23_00215 [Archangium sp.]|nr:hypothetical protein [Archangium sp.]MDP3151056.1 hypothetical protein [Archangium sp.]MDP3571740.1 hypothetical protein [Archangium sp.]